ncbi:unnamed protein product, partial [Symbiodinium sp. CCMP2456]
SSYRCLISASSLTQVASRLFRFCAERWAGGACTAVEGASDRLGEWSFLS